MFPRRFNVFSWTASTPSSEYQPSRRNTSPSATNRPPSYASHARSNATNPSLDIYEGMEGITLEMASSTNIPYQRALR